jgi:hypothetical protein
MNNWVILDPSQFKVSPEKGMAIHVGFSPYDFPTAVRAFWDETSKTARIEFQYLTSEKIETSALDRHVTAEFGQKTKRLYGLRIDTRAAGVDAVNLTCQKLREAVKGAFRSLHDAPTGIGSPNRYRLAEDAIEQNSDQLFSFA